MAIRNFAPEALWPSDDAPATLLKNKRVLLVAAAGALVGAALVGAVWAFSK